ncbi:MAG: hypothetical protein KGH84_01990 [Paracoccaceae bacterium]|nr:hypothetical protein [Paracoccaceae bacterium]
MTVNLARMAQFSGQSCGLIDQLAPAGKGVARTMCKAGETLATVAR